MNKNTTFKTLIIPFIFLLTACGGSSTEDASQQNSNTSIVSPPVTETPVTETPVTETPVTESPVTESPVAESPVTESPVAESPVTGTPVTGTPVAGIPVAGTPVNETPVNETPVTESPVAGTPVTESPIAELPVTESPVAGTPVTESPVAESPVAETPVTESPVAGTPVTEDPISGVIAVSLIDISIEEGGLVSIQAEITTDLDDESLSYAWSVSPFVDLTLTDELSDSINFIAPFSDGEDIILSLTLTVTNKTGLSASASSTVTVFNDIPSVSFSNNITAYEKQIITIDSVIASKNNIESYVWTIANLPADIITPNNDSATVVIPALDEDINTSITLTITDSDGDSASATTELSALQIFEPLTINGLITDSPIKNSNVIIDIGNRQVNTQANEDGEYSVSIKIDDDETDVIIKITGLGVDAQANAGLVSILGNAGDLLAQAGNDGLLNAEKNFAVNVTHITTAQYGLMLYENNGNAIASKKTLDELSSKIDFNQTMEIANAVKLVIDYSDNVSGLPSGVINTLSLVENIPVALNYVKTLSSSQEVYASAYNSTLNDINAIQTSSFEMPKALHWVVPGVPNYSVPIWQFYNNNEGSYAGNIFTWQVSGNVISGNYTYPIIETNSDMLLSSVGPVRVNYQEIPTSFMLTVVNNDNGMVEFVHNRTVTKIYDSDTIEALGIDDPSGEYTFINGHTSYRNSARQNIVDLRGKVAYLPIKKLQVNDDNGILTISADKYSFADNGTGSTLYSGQTFTWLQTDNSVVISTIISEDTTETSTISLFHDGTNVGPTAFNSAASDIDDITTLGGIGQDNIAWNINEIAGVYESTFKSRDNTLSHLWFELKENGDADTFATNDDNRDGVISADELYQAYGKWDVEDNKVTVTRVVKVNTEESSPDHRVPDGEEWQQFHKRTWELISRDNNRYGILNKHNFTVGLAYPQTYAPKVAEIIYEIRLLEKLNEAPVDISDLLK